MNPLSPMQQGMLFHSLQARQPGVDIEQLMCRLHESVDAPAFERAWQWLVDRHPVLRTSFHWREHEEPRQQVHATVRFQLESADWSALSSELQQRQMEEYLGADRQRGFDVSQPCLMRGMLARLGPEEWWFAWTFHHLLLDIRAMAVLINELFCAYEAMRQGRAPELKPPHPYSDYLDWLQTLDLGAAEKFWRRTLEGFTSPVTLKLASTTREPEAEDFLGVQAIEFTRETTARLNSFARENGLTLNTLLQGAWALLLSRYSGMDDIVFGAVRACRHASVSGADSMVGLLINTVPVRIRVESKWTLSEYLKSVRSSWVALREFEHTPLVKVQGWSDVARDIPLFETLVNHQEPAWDSVLRAQGGDWERREFSLRNQSNYPLAMDSCGGTQLSIKILYHRHRFGDAVIARMLGHLKKLLEAMPGSAAEPLSTLPMVTGVEQHQLLTEWNDTRADFPEDKCVPDLVAAAAARTPDAPAVEDGRTRITYRELDEQSTRLAEHLQELGVGPDVTVGVCLERSVAMVTGLLAILKAGGAYVPLDPSYPRERLAFMLKDSGAAVVLTERRFLELLNHPASICLDASASILGEPVRKPFKSAVRPKNLAYVIYTSGSTGEPKGVEIDHAGLTNLVAWHQQAYTVTTKDRATQLASPAFDASVWELWPYLTAGASIHIPDEAIRLSPERLVAWLVQKRITLTFLPTPLAEAVMNETWPEGGRLRAILTGGDKLHQAPRADFPCQVFNHYGPTENSVVSTWARVIPGTEETPSIGRPIANTQVYVLDRNRQPTPIGVPGELYVAGKGLARGYRNRRELTQDRFVSNPLSKEKDSRMYRTGDLVRWLPDGCLEFLGRIDDQVKIRGLRIELGEIEAALLSHPQIREAVALARGDAGKRQRLVAWVVAGDPAPAVDELRSYLERKLPDYMIPATFVFLNRMPITSNGKVDRAAMRTPEINAERQVAPLSKTEKTLSGIWCALLGLVQVGVNDDFFELGGHSLLATQLIARIARVFEVDLPLRDVFKARTIEALARLVDGLHSSLVARRFPPMVRNQPGNAPTLTFAQERLWFLEQLEPGRSFNNMPLVLRLEGVLDVVALSRSLDEIIRRHQTLRMAFSQENGRPMARILPDQSIPISTVDLGQLPGPERIAEAGRLVQAEAHIPFDLRSGPLWRTRLLRLGAEEHLLCITVHHIISDGWSVGVLFRELGELYTALVNGRQWQLPELAMEYGDFASWQREWLQSESMSHQMAYWKEQLRGPLPLMELPANRPRPAKQSYRGDSCRVELPPGLSGAVRRCSQQHNATPFMVLLAAFQALLHRYTGGEDIVVGTPVAGRSHLETEPLIGLFVNTLVLRTDLTGDPTFVELLERVRRVAMDAYANQDVPFERLVAQLQPQRDLGRSPLFQVMFAYQNAPTPVPVMPGVRVTASMPHNGAAKFDLTLSLEESGADLVGYIEYNTDLFEASTIQRFASHYQTILEGSLQNPHHHLSALPVLPEAEKQRVVVEWNKTVTEFRRDECVHQLVAAQAERTPEAVALVFGGEEWSFRKLHHRAQAIAVRMRSAGVGPDVPVAICVERSLEMVAGLLGILQAGGCYVPLDPGYPRERLEFMIQDSGARVVVTQTSRRGDFSKGDFEVICVDAPLSAPDLKGASFAAVTPDHLAYINYTSGSTGRPKGVMVAHRNVVNFFAGMDGVIGTRPGIWLALTSISFDISVLELFWTLARGFKVVLAPGKEDVRPGQTTADLIVRHAVSHLQCTPSFARTLNPGGEPSAALQLLRVLILGGEALPAALVKQLRRQVWGTLYNLYGPTETTVWSTAWRVDDVASGISIGRPIANTQIHVLDQHLQPVPIGVPGELFIGGEGVARGYLNQPELTAQKFIPDPFQAHPKARLYRTGDRARWRPDGNIEFLGRLDHQVKIRGHRIEPGEIESALGEHPGIGEAVVVLRTDRFAEGELVAYLVGKNGPVPIAALRSFLQARLPASMVPAQFTWLDCLPQTPNGKVDRKALPAPDSDRTALGTVYVAPRGKLEAVLTRIWQELLRVDKVGRNDSFFDLGGHSLLVVQLQACVREQTGVDVPVVKFFQFPTISSFAVFLNEGEAPVTPGVEERAQRQRAAFSKVKRELLEEPA